MNDFIKVSLIGIIGTVIGGLILWKVVLMIESVKIDKVIAYLPYANDYNYPNGKTYLNASPAGDMERDINPKNPIPLNIKKDEQKLTLGVRNINSKTINDIKLFLTFPDEFEVTRFQPWQNYTNKNYNIGLGNINSGIGHNAAQPIFFAVKKPGRYYIIYTITGSDLKQPITKVMTFNAYEQ
ncbi:MAG: hypothetical protein NTY76_00735 [Candidatus Omnitrophica bacterium]|nr:hypothetical protein [Candidatus Omnitrophota bacterium]